jgi:hypothetical protein
MRRDIELLPNRRGRGECVRRRVRAASSAVGLPRLPLHLRDSYEALAFCVRGESRERAGGCWRDAWI